MIVADQEGLEGGGEAALLALVPAGLGVVAAGLGLAGKLIGGGGSKGPSATELQIQEMQREKKAAAGRRSIYLAIGGGVVLLLLVGGIGLAVAKKGRRS